MSKVWKIGIAVLAVLLMAMGTVSATPSVSVTDDTVLYGDPVEIKVVNDGSAGTLTLKVENTNTGDSEVLAVISTTGIFTYSYDTDEKEWYPGIYNATITNGTMSWNATFYVYTDKPYILLEIDDTTVAKGDALSYSLEVYWNKTFDGVEVNVTGPIKMEYQVEYNDSVSSNYYKAQNTTVDTAILFGSNYSGTTGAYKLKVRVWKGSENYNTSQTFYVEDITFTLSPEATTVARGGSIDVVVETNVADTGSDMDLGNNNTVYWEFYNKDNKSQFVNGTEDIDDGMATITLEPRLEWDSGTYTLYVKVNTSSAAGYNETDEIDIEVTDPELTLEPNYVVLTRGDSVTIEGTTTLPVGTPLNVYVDPDTGDVDVSKTTVNVDAEGKFSFDVEAKSDAELRTYTIKVNSSETDIEATVKVKVVRQGISVSTEETSVLIGGEFDVTIDTTASKVFVYASKNGVFEVGSSSVGKVPSLSTKFNTSGAYNTSDDEITIKVNKNAQLGTYVLYFFAPENTNEIDPIKDPQDILYVTIRDIAFLEVPEEVTLVKGGKVELTVTVDTPKKDFANISATFSGNGVFTDLDDAKLVDEDEATDEKGVFKITLYGKVNKDYLNMSEDGTKMLATGTYSLKLTLSRDSTTVDTRTIMVNVVNPEIEVSVPSEVVKGDVITVTVDSNRAEDYDGFYVFLETPNQVYVLNPITDENGTAVAEFQTYGMDYGTYKIYVRDTMTTGTNNEDLKKFYNLDPADSTAKQIGFSDDILLGPFEVKVVEELTPTPTPTPTPTLTPTATPTPTPTPTPEKTPTPQVTPTKEETPKPTPTTTEEKKQGPGFEAVFAVAGLLAVAYLLRRRQ